jgi:hypothetical protein
VTLATCYLQNLRRNDPYWNLTSICHYDEVSSFRFNDVKVHDNHLVLHLEKSQTDQYRQSSDVLIAKGSTVACPYSMFLRYVSLAGFSSDKHLSFTFALAATVAPPDLTE